MELVLNAYFIFVFLLLDKKRITCDLLIPVFLLSSITNCLSCAQRTIILLYESWYCLLIIKCEVIYIIVLAPQETIFSRKKTFTGFQCIADIISRGVRTMEGSLWSSVSAGCRRSINGIQSIVFLKKQLFLYFYFARHMWLIAYPLILNK